jgi:Bardet-Biedl syndrome 5 protein
MRESKFGRAIVLETFAKAGGYILGFRVDPKERVNDVFKEMISLYQVYSTTPVFGVEFNVEAADNPSNASSGTHLELLSANTSNTRVSEDVELTDEHEDTHAIAAYYAQNGTAGGDDQDTELVQYDPKLGLAVETLVNGLTLEQLWRVM